MNPRSDRPYPTEPAVNEPPQNPTVAPWRAMPDAEEQLSLLDELSTLLSNSYEVDTVYHLVARMLVPVLGDACMVIQSSERMPQEVLAVQFAVAEQAVAWQALEREDFLVMERSLGWQRTIATTESSVYERMAGEEWADRPALDRVMPQSALVVPLAVRGRVHGVLVLAITTSARAYVPQDLRYAEILGRRIALFMDNAMRYRSAQGERAVAERAAYRMVQLQSITSSMGIALNRDEVATHLVQHSVDALHADLALVVVRSDDDAALDLLSAYGYEEPDLDSWRRIPLDSRLPLCNAVVTGRAVWLANDAEIAAAYPHFHERIHRSHHYQALASIPLVLEGRSIGAIGLAFSAPQTWTTHDQSWVYSIAQLCAQALERARLFDAERRARIEAEQESVRREAAEATTRQHMQQLRLLTDALPVLISYIDTNQRYLFANKTYEDWFGIRASEAVGKQVSEVLGAETYAAARPYIERVLTGERISYDVVLPMKNGTRRNMQANYVPHISDDGQVVGYFVLIIDDSAHKRAKDVQTLLTEATALLSSSLDYETTLTNVCSLAVPRIADWCSINLIDEQGALERVAALHVDPRKQAILDDLRRRTAPTLQSNEAAARSLRAARPLLIREFDDQSLRSITESEEQYEVYRSLDYRSAMFVPMCSSERVIGSLVLVVSDSDHRFDDDDLELAQNIANRAAVAIENARLFRQVQDTVRVRDEFLSIAAHELRTPVTSLSGYAQLLSSRFVPGYTLDERDVRAIHVIDTQAERLTKLIGLMLDVARIERGQFALDVYPVDFSRLVADTVDELRPTLDLHTIDTTGVDHGIMILGDDQRLQQVILNLLQNAVKYSPEGGPVVVALHARDGFATLSLSDSGIGIPAAAHESLFQRFYRAPNAIASSISGVGLGLFVVHEIVTRHGGTVDLTSTEGHGSTFRLRLPLRDADTPR